MTETLTDLTSRAQWALRWLAENSDCAVPFEASASGYDVPRKTAYAFRLSMDWHDTEHGYKGQSTRGGDTAAAANTLVALKRRGLAANDGGGAWLQAKWWITPEGAQILTAENSTED